MLQSRNFGEMIMTPWHHFGLQARAAYSCRTLDMAQNDCVAPACIGSHTAIRR